jgi:hypothetical protein
VHRRNGSRPLDLCPITRQPSDLTRTARGLPLGFQLSAYRDSREQENRNTSSLEIPTRSEPPVCEDTWQDREPIDISEVWKARLLEHQKSRKREIGSGLSACGDVWQISRPLGKSRRGGRPSEFGSSGYRRSRY